MDEPEVHLHPEWQVKLAEIIVMLAKELNITSYINSHSPQFIEAIQTYSLYYKIIDSVKFYMTKECENKSFDIVPVDTDDTEKIFGHLNSAFTILDMINADIPADNILKNKK
jgi:ABC-type multidrug transport system ATPase subunit